MVIGDDTYPFTFKFEHDGRTIGVGVNRTYVRRVLGCDGSDDEMQECVNANQERLTVQALAHEELWVNMHSPGIDYACMLGFPDATADWMDRHFLGVATAEAQKGLSEGGIPIGSVLVRNGEIIGRGHNRRVQKGDPILHGEMDAIQNAGRQKSYKDVTCYTTLSPCMMCTGTIIQFGISRVVVAESENFKGFQDVLSLAGVEVHDAHDERCVHMMADFIETHPELWNEDIGE